MNRSLLMTAMALALAVGVWALVPDGEHMNPEKIASPTDSSTAEVIPPPSLPAPVEAAALAVTGEELERGSLDRPLLSLLARSASGGRELSRARATIEPVDAETSTISIEADASKGSSTELEPGAWRVTFEAEGFVPQTHEVDLALGDEESLEVMLQRAAIVRGNVRDRFGRKLSGSKLFFLAPGQVHPRFPREAADILTTLIDKEGNITPISLPPEQYTITYGNLGSPKLQTAGRLNAGETTELEVVFGGTSVVRFVINSDPEQERKLQIRLEEQDEEKLERDRIALQQNPEKAAKLKQKGKTKGRWRARGTARVKDGVGEIYRAKPGTYRVTLLTRPGEYSSLPLLVLSADESVLVNIRIPVLPKRSGDKRNDSKTPKEGPLDIMITRNPQTVDWIDDGIYWR